MILTGCSPPPSPEHAQARFSHPVASAAPRRCPRAEARVAEGCGPRLPAATEEEAELRAAVASVRDAAFQVERDDLGLRQQNRSRLRQHAARAEPDPEKDTQDESDERVTFEAEAAELAKRQRCGAEPNVSAKLLVPSGEGPPVVRIVQSAGDAADSKLNEHVRLVSRVGCEWKLVGVEADTALRTPDGEWVFVSHSLTSMCEEAVSVFRLRGTEREGLFDEKEPRLSELCSEPLRKLQWHATPRTRPSIGGSRRSRRIKPGHELAARLGRHASSSGTFHG